MASPVIVIAGPTASGKTDVAAALALLLDGEVVSADSMQVYKYMDIGTAKPTLSEMRGVRHHLIDELYPDEQYSAAVFTQIARMRIDDIIARGKTPIVAGGTGFYIKALLGGAVFDDHEGKSNNIRKHFEGIARQHGRDYLYSLLLSVDPESASSIHPNNEKRVIRALEYYELTGDKMSAYNDDQRSRSPRYDARVYILSMDRALLYERIDSRVDAMFAAGLTEEVKKLLDMGYARDLVSMQGLGYKETVGYLDGNMMFSDTVDMIKTRTRHFAKRQLTWFRHQCEGVWLSTTEFRTVDDLAKHIIKSFKKGVLLYE